jgi:hypothetical protein
MLGESRTISSAMGAGEGILRLSRPIVAENFWVGVFS